MEEETEAQEAKGRRSKPIKTNFFIHSIDGQTSARVSRVSFYAQRGPFKAPIHFAVAFGDNVKNTDKEHSPMRNNRGYRPNRNKLFIAGKRLIETIPAGKVG